MRFTATSFGLNPLKFENITDLSQADLKPLTAYVYKFVIRVAWYNVNYKKSLETESLNITIPKNKHITNLVYEFDEFLKTHIKDKFFY